MIHDISGKATVLSIMNELHSNEKLQKIIDNLISFILKKRKDLAETDADYDLQDLNKFFNSIIEQSKIINNMTSDSDINSSINSLINVLTAYSALFNDSFTDDENCKNLLIEKSIVINSKIFPLNLVTALLLIIKGNCEILCKEGEIFIQGVNYNFFRQINGIINFLKEKYELNDEFLAGKNCLLIKYKLLKK